MALKVLHVEEVKQKTKKKAAALEAKSEIVQKVDEFIDLSSEIEEMADSIKRHAALKKELADIANKDFPANESVVFEGTKGSVLFSKRSESTEITDMNGLIGKLKDTVGYEVLLGMLKLTIADCKKYLSEHEFGKFTDKVAGSRSFKGIVKK